MTKINQDGMFNPLVLLLMVAVIGVTAFAAYRVGTNNSISKSKESAATNKPLAFSNAESLYLPDEDKEEVNTVDSTEREEEKPLTAEPEKDPNKFVSFKNSDPYYGFGLEFPETWTHQACVDRFQSGYTSYRVWLEADGEALPGCDEYKRSPEVVLQFGNYYFPNYSEESDKKADGTYQKEVTFEYVTLNNKKVLKKRTVWTGAGGLIPKDTVSTDYKHRVGDRLYWASYRHEVGTTDHTEAFENVVKNHWMF